MKKPPAPVRTVLSGLLEAGWLIALVTTPLFFDAQSSRSFEPDKAILIRAVAIMLVIALMAASGTIQQWKTALQAGWRRARRSDTLALGGAVLFFLTAQLLASALSISPSASLGGSFVRLQGIASLASYLFLGGVVAGFLTQPAQWRRFLTAMLCGSGAVVVCGLAQHAGWIPVLATSRFGTRISSTLGNPVFLGAYLLLVVPFTLHQLFSSIEERRGSNGRAPFRGGWRRATPTVCWTVLLLAQLATVILSQSRGAAAGLAASLLTYGLLRAIRRSRTRLVRVLLVGAVVAVGTVAVAQTPGSPLGFLRMVPYVGRLIQLDLHQQTGRVRTLVWQGVADTLADRPGRIWLGFGPETLKLAFNDRYPAELGTIEDRDNLPDRAHNGVWDALFHTGLLGLSAYLLLFFLLLTLGLRTSQIGLDRRSFWVWSGCWWGGGLLGSLVGVATGQWVLIGLLAPLSMVVGLFAFLFRQSRRMRRPPHRAPRSNRPAVPVTAAMVGHFVETQLSFPTTTTSVLFWLLVGVLVAVSMRPALRHRPPSPPSVLPFALLAAITVLTTTYSLFTPPVSNTETLFTLLLVLATTVTIVIASTSQPSQLLATTMGAASWTFLGLIFVLSQLCPTSEPQTKKLSFFFVALVTISVLLWRWTNGADLRRRLSRLRQITLGLGLVLAGLAVDRFCLDEIRADIYFKAARAFQDARRYQPANSWFERAIQLRSAYPRYWLYRGKALLEWGQRLPPDSKNRTTVWREAEGAFQHALEREPLDPHHWANLGSFHAIVAEQLSNPNQRRAHLRASIEYFEHALSIRPQSVVFLTDLAASYRAAGDAEMANQTIERAVELDDSYREGQLMRGLVYHDLGDLAGAVSAWTRVVEMDPAFTPARAHLAAVLQTLGQTQAAILQYRAILDQTPRAHQARRNLVDLLRKTDQEDAARRVQEEGLSLPPPDPRLQSLTTDRDGAATPTPEPP